MLRPAADQVISQTGDASIQRGSFVTTPLRLTEDGSECVQGVVPGSVMTVIHSVWYLFLPLGMVFVFCLLCIVLLWRAWRQQRRLEQFRKDFTYSMIHDMKSPLQTILMGTQNAGKVADWLTKPEKNGKR